MISGADNLGDRVAIVFGGRSPIAIASARCLAARQKVILVSRNIEVDLSEQVSDLKNIEIAEVDLEDREQIRQFLKEIYLTGKSVSSIVFLQRYRTETDTSFYKHCAVELWSVQEAIEIISAEKKKEETVQVLIGTSPAADKILLDQSLSYHIVKAGQETIVRYCAAMYTAENIAVTAVRIGSIVLKRRAMPFWRKQPSVMSELTKGAPFARVQTSEDVGENIAEIASMDTIIFSGQTIHIEDGWELKDPAQVVRAALESS